MVDGHRRVLDIAVDYQFNNHETFSRAFKRMFGMQPVQWRERGILPRCALMPAISPAYLEHIHHPGFQPPQPTSAPQRRLAGLMTPLAALPDVVTSLWHSLQEAQAPRSSERGQAHYFGVTSYLDEQGVQAFYLTARALEPEETVEPHWVCQALPAGDYVCMAHPVHPAGLPLTLAYLYHTWLPKARLQPAYPLEIVEFGDTPPVAKPAAQVTLWLPVKGIAAANRAP